MTSISTLRHLLATTLALLALAGCSDGATPSGGDEDGWGIIGGDGDAQDSDGLQDVVPVSDGLDATETAIPDASGDASAPLVSPYPPVEAWGPYAVGTWKYEWFDASRGRKVPTAIWYPATGTGDIEAYMDLISGNAHHESPPELSGAPYPLVLFSHGFQGTHFQSFTFTEYVASHGYVVVSPDHEGNTMLDFNASDEQVAQVALERPADLRFAYDEMMKLAGGDGPLAGIVAPGKVAVTGHSFGGYTALMAAGGIVDVDEAVAACAAGTPSDLFCPYIGYWPAGTVVKLDPPIPGVSAALYLAPGGAAAFGETGLDSIGVPGFVFGGTLDHMTTLEDEVEPIYDGHPAPKLKAIVTNAGHMSFTNICAIPGISFFLEDFCGVEGLKEAEETFAVVNPLAVAFLHLHLKGDQSMALKLKPGVAEATYPDLELTAEGMD